MSVELFDAGNTELRAIYEGERIVQVRTTNSSDELYAITDLTGDELVEEIKAALRSKYGTGARYAGHEDVTDLYYDEDGFAL